VEYSIKVQLLEIYNESIRDLLVRTTCKAWWQRLWLPSSQPRVVVHCLCINESLRPAAVPNH